MRHRHHHGQPVRLGDDAARRRDARPARRAYEARIVSAHRTPDRLFDYARAAQGRGLKVDHRRGRRRGAPAGDGGGDDAAAGARRAGREPHPAAASTACCRSSRCRPASRSARSRSARPAPSTPPCSPPRSWPSPTRSRRRAGRLARRRRPTPWPSAPSDAAMASGQLMLPPGGTIGILGGGQLGRMSALAAARLGYRSPHLRHRARQPGRAGRRRGDLAPYGDAGGARRASPPRSTS